MKHFSPSFFPMSLCVALLGGAAARTSAAPTLDPQEIPEFLQGLAPLSAPGAGPSPVQITATEAPRISMTDQGFVRSIGAPSSQHFPPEAGAVSGKPEESARSFLLKHARVFGVQHPAVDFVMMRNRQSNGRSHLRLQQTYHGLPVVAGEVVVQINDQGGVQSVLSDLATRFQAAGTGLASVVPVLSSDAAAAEARGSFAAQGSPADFEGTAPQLAVFDPEVLDESGPQELVWDLEVSKADRSQFHFRVLVNADTGGIVRAWTLNPTALNRQISDQNNNPTGTATVVRTEGQPASGIPDADAAYAFLGDTYNFYLTRHSRDSYDGAGAAILMTVRYCDTNNPCPWGNASAGSPIIFGSGFTVDDVVAHEFTHNVTAAESKLIYANASGAINESLSDVWGEFVDLNNGGANDTANVRWQIGEDLASGAQRSMSFPTNFNHPDRLSSTNYVPPASSPNITNDWGGVHSNSGVNNKLCYLLTDGDSFNGQTISGLGINAVAGLYYEVQVNWLTSGAGWAELYNALREAAVSLGWNTADRNNLYRACLAVELITETDGQPVYVDWSSVCSIPYGYPVCSMGYGPYLTVGQGVNGANPGDVLRIRAGNYYEPMTITRILTLQADNGPVTIGQ